MNCLKLQFHTIQIMWLIIINWYMYLVLSFIGAYCLQYVKLIKSCYMNFLKIQLNFKN